jgi:hypothetical protein
LPSGVVKVPGLVAIACRFRADAVGQCFLPQAPDGAIWLGLDGPICIQREHWGDAEPGVAVDAVSSQRADVAANVQMLLSWVIRSQSRQKLIR